MSLPWSALFRWQDKPAVWVVDPASHTVAPKTVAIERYAGSAIVLSNGIAPGERVVTAGIQLLVRPEGRGDRGGRPMRLATTRMPALFGLPSWPAASEGGGGPAPGAPVLTTAVESAPPRSSAPSPGTVEPR